MIAFFQALPLLYRLAGVLALAGSLIGGYALWHHKIYQEGYNVGRTEIQKRWDEAVQIAIQEGERARQDADRDVAAASPDELRRDPYNRDRDK